MDTAHRARSSEEMIREAKELQNVAPSSQSQITLDSAEDGLIPDPGSRRAVDGRVEPVSPYKEQQSAPSTIRLKEASMPPSRRAAARVRRVAVWVAAALVIAIAVIAVVSPTQEEGDTATPVVETSEDLLYEGVWSIQYETGARLRLTFTLFPNGTARKNGRGVGTWQTVDGTAQIVWRDGWRDRIRPRLDDPTAFENDAYRPGTSFNVSPISTATATRVTAS